MVGAALGQETRAEELENWAALSKDVFGDRPLKDGSGLIALEAPVNHPDAGAIPVAMRATGPAEGPNRIEKLTLIVDENPAPVVASFAIGDSATISRIDTTIRVNRFSFVHLVAETADGSLYVVDRYVKGSGGCSARGLDLPEVAGKTLGEMEFAEFTHRAAPNGVERDLAVTVKHPNYTGMQQNYITLHYILPHFVTEMALREGDAEVMRIESGISVSENPQYRVTYTTTAPAGDLVADVTDSEGLRFRRSWPLGAPGS